MLKVHLSLVVLTIALLFLAPVNVSNGTGKIITQTIRKMVNTIKKLADDPLRTATALAKNRCERYENKIINMKDSNSATLDIVYEIDKDIEELKSHNIALSNQFRDGLVAMLNKDWTNVKEILLKLPPNWIIDKKYFEFINKQGILKEDKQRFVDTRNLL